MNRSDLTAAVASTTGLSTSQASAAVDAVLEAVVGAVAGGERVSLAGFGTFESRARSARTGRNPQTGAAIEIAASTVPAFKPAAQFKSKVRG